MEKDPRVESAVRKMVRRRQTQYLRKLSGSTFNRPAPEQGSNYLGRRTRRQAHPHLPAVASRGLPLRECAQTKQDQEGRPDHYLSPEHPRGRHRRSTANIPSISFIQAVPQENRREFYTRLVVIWSASIRQRNISSISGMKTFFGARQMSAG